MKRIVPGSLRVYAQTVNGKRHLGWMLDMDDGSQVHHVIDTGVSEGEPWTLATTHRLMQAFAHDIATSVQAVVLS